MAAGQAVLAKLVSERDIALTVRCVAYSCSRDSPWGLMQLYAIVAYTAAVPCGGSLLWL